MCVQYMQCVCSVHAVLVHAVFMQAVLQQLNSNTAPTFHTHNTHFPGKSSAPLAGTAVWRV